MPFAKPRLVNRGAAGLLSKPAPNGAAAAADPAKVAAAARVAKIIKTHKRDNFLPELAKLTVDIGKPVLDPNNARLHPERNMEAIMLSLATYGQRTPITVNRRTMHVLKGNGTLQALRNLGWTKVAKVWCDDDEATAAGYGLADNRSGELSSWDFEAVARLERIVADAGGDMVGWTAAEIESMRAREWVPPDEFPEVDENIVVEHQCPKCGYFFSGGAVKNSNEEAVGAEAGDEEA